MTTTESTRDEVRSRIVQHTIPIYRTEMVSALELYAHKGRIEDGIAALRNEGLELITARELAEARIFGGARHPISQADTWVAEHFISTPTSKELLVVDRAHNLFLQSPENAVAAAKKEGRKYAGEEGFPVDAEIVSRLRELATTDGRYGILLLRMGCQHISVTTLAEHPFTSFLFRDLAGPYGRFLEGQGVEEVYLWLPSPGTLWAPREGSYGQAIAVNGGIRGDSKSGRIQSWRIQSCICKDDLRCDYQYLVCGIRRRVADSATPEANVEARILEAVKHGRQFTHGDVTYIPTYPSEHRWGR